MSFFISEPEYALGINGLAMIDSDGNIEYSFARKRGGRGDALIDVNGDGNLVFSRAGGRITFAENPPENPVDGEMWYDTADDYKVYAYYEEEGIWVDMDTDIFARPSNLGSSSLENPTALSILDKDGILLKELIAVGSGGDGEGIVTKEENQNAFSYVQVGNELIEADSSLDTLTLVAGEGISISATPATDQIVISSTASGSFGLGAGTIFFDNAPQPTLSIAGDSRSLVTVDYTPNPATKKLLCFFQSSPSVYASPIGDEDRDFDVYMVEGGSTSSADRGFRADGNFGPVYPIAGERYLFRINTTSSVPITDPHSGNTRNPGWLNGCSFWGIIDLEDTTNFPSSGKVTNGRRISVIVPEGQVQVTCQLGKPMGYLTIYEIG